MSRELYLCAQTAAHFIQASLSFQASISMEPPSAMSASGSMTFASNPINAASISDALRLAPSAASGTTKYSRLASEPDSPVRSFSNTSAFLQQQQQQQQQLLQHQDHQLGQMSESVGNLRNVSTAIGRELDEHAVTHQPAVLKIRTIAVLHCIALLCSNPCDCD